MKRVKRDYNKRIIYSFKNEAITCPGKYFTNFTFYLYIFLTLQCIKHNLIFLYNKQKLYDIYVYKKIIIIIMNK